VAARRIRTQLLLSRRLERSADFPQPHRTKGRTAPTLTMMRLCPSIHTFSHERIPSGHSGERAMASRPLVRASDRICESNHCAALRSTLPGLALSPGNRRLCPGELMGFFSNLLAPEPRAARRSGDGSAGPASAFGSPSRRHAGFRRRHLGVDREEKLRQRSVESWRYCAPSSTW
jgi:hypothetical protein